ncbi:MAG: hypothetical protein ACLRFN_01960 [Alphaproteobacteria bacterium]
MAPYIIFNSRHFLDEVAKVKKFWLRTKRNRLRFETNKAEKRILPPATHILTFAISYLTMTVSI